MSVRQVAAAAATAVGGEHKAADESFATPLGRLAPRFRHKASYPPPSRACAC